MRKLTVYLAALLLFLLPLKFGGLAVMPEYGGFFPEFFIDWLVVTWHPHALAYAGTLLLAAALLTTKKKAGQKSLLFTLFWCVLPSLAVLPGIINGESIIALGEISLLTGMATVTAAVMLLTADAPERAALFISALIAGGAATACYGWYQHFVTLDEMRRFAAEQEAAGIPLSEGMQLKLTDPRIFSTLASSNVLASLLLIMLTCGMYAAEYWSRFITPPRTTRIVFRMIFAVLFISVLVLTRSRSAVFCPVAAGLIALFSTPKIKVRWKIAGLTAGILIMTAGVVFALHHGRGIASMGERADYWRTCAILCRTYPLAGAGWGGFFRTHMQIKLSDVDESARDPHNVVAAFASQCGIVSGLVMLAVLLLPLILLWRSRFEKNWCGMVLWCGILFTVHSLIDCDWQIPALPAIMGALYAIAIALLPEEKFPAYAPYAAGTVSILLMLTGCWSSWRYIAGDHALSALQDKVNPATGEMAQKLAACPVEYFVAQAEKYRPDSAVTQMYAGDWYLRNNDLISAEKAFQRVLELDPVRPGAYARLAKIALLRGDRKKAEELMLKAHELFPKSRHYTLEKLYGDK